MRAPTSDHRWRRRPAVVRGPAGVLHELHDAKRCSSGAAAQRPCWPPTRLRGRSWTWRRSPNAPYFAGSHDPYCTPEEFGEPFATSVGASPERGWRATATGGHAARLPRARPAALRLKGQRCSRGCVSWKGAACGTLVTLRAPDNRTVRQRSQIGCSRDVLALVRLISNA